MKTTPVKSSYIESVGYDSLKETLEVEFKGGKRHVYANVSSVTYNELMKSDSIGAYFRSHIIGKHQSEQIHG